MSGCGAALAAKKAGLKVALIQDRPLFGGNAQSGSPRSLHSVSKVKMKR